MVTQRSSDRKLVDAFLGAGDNEGSNFLNSLDDRIGDRRQQRRAVQQTNRAIGGGAFQGNSPFRNTPQVSPTGSGGRTILQQGMGPVRPVNGARMALPSASRGLPAVPGANSVVPAGMPTGMPAPRGLGPSVPTPGAPTTNIPGTGSPIPAGPGASSAARAAGGGAMGGSPAGVRAAGAQAGQLLQSNTPGTTARATGMIKGMASQVTAQSLMKGGSIATGGLMVSQFLDGMDIGGEQSFLDKTLSGGVLGASLGGGAAVALGLGTGPAGWAALGGALMFAGAKNLWGDPSYDEVKSTLDTTRATVSELGEMYGLSDEAMDDILFQFDAGSAMYTAEKDGTGLKEYLAGVGTQLPALMLQARETDKTRTAEQDRYDTMMQTQAQFAPMFEQQMDCASQASQTAYQTANASATYLDQRQPQLAALFRQTAAQSQASAANLQAAYAAQVAQQPVITGTIDQLDRQLAEQEMMQQQLAGMGQFP